MTAPSCTSVRRPTTLLRIAAPARMTQPSPMMALWILGEGCGEGGGEGEVGRWRLCAGQGLARHETSRQGAPRVCQALRATSNASPQRPRPWRAAGSGSSCRWVRPCRRSWRGGGGGGGGGERGEGRAARVRRRLRGARTHGVRRGRAAGLRACVRPRLAPVGTPPAPLSPPEVVLLGVGERQVCVVEGLDGTDVLPVALERVRLHLVAHLARAGDDLGASGGGGGDGRVRARQQARAVRFSRRAASTGRAAAQVPCPRRCGRAPRFRSRWRRACAPLASP
jgi:hypothetical protein